jgi:Mrp family chromosome partitioning ATPase
LNDRITSRTDLESKIVGLPILGEVSQKPKKILDPLLDTTSNHFVVEQFRILRTNLQFFVKRENTSQKILLTSSISGEGKSFVSLNLSASLASSGFKVLLINLDIRKPKLHEYLDLPNHKGIVNYLIGKANSSEITQNTPVDNLRFVSSTNTTKSSRINIQW